MGDMTEGEVSNWWFKLGIYYGTTVFLVLYTPDDFQPYDPLDEYTGLSDGDHLEDKWSFLYISLKTLPKVATLK